MFAYQNEFKGACDGPEGDLTQGKSPVDDATTVVNVVELEGFQRCKGKSRQLFLGAEAMTRWRRKEISKNGG